MLVVVVLEPHDSTADVFEVDQLVDMITLAINSNIQLATIKMRK